MHDALYSKPDSNQYRYFIRDNEQEVIVNLKDLILIEEIK